MDVYYLLKNDQQSGPFAAEAIRGKVVNGKLDRNDLCWKEGMEEWEPIQQKISLPPVPALSPMPQSTTSTENPVSGDTAKLDTAVNLDPGIKRPSLMTSVADKINVMASAIGGGSVMVAITLDEVHWWHAVPFIFVSFLLLILATVIGDKAKRDAQLEGD